MWASSFYFGNFLGPTVAGILVDSIGFRRTSMVFFSLYLLMAAVDAAELAYRVAGQRKERRKQYEQLE